jgi:hypothetical protein
MGPGTECVQRAHDQGRMLKVYSGLMKKRSEVGTLVIDANIEVPSRQVGTLNSTAAKKIREGFGSTTRQSSSLAVSRAMPVAAAQKFRSLKPVIYTR